MGPGDTGSRARLLAAQVAAFDAAFEWRQRRQVALEAIDVARRANDDAAFFDVVTTTNLTLATADHREQQCADIAMATAIADKAGDPIVRARIRFAMMWSCYQRADLEGADAVLGEIATIAQTTGLPRPQVELAMFATGRLLGAGRLEAAEESNQRFLELGTAAGVPETLATFGGLLHSIRTQQGRVDEIASFFIDAARDNPSIAALRSAVAHMLCDLGRLDEAHDQLVAEAAGGFDFPYDIVWLAAIANMADVAATTADFATTAAATAAEFGCAGLSRRAAALLADL